MPGLPWRKKDDDVSRLEAEGYLRVRERLLPVAQAVLAVDDEVITEAVQFAEHGVEKLRSNPTVGAGQAERSGNELEVLRAVVRFRKELAKLAEGQAARARLTEGIVNDHGAES